MWLTLFHTVTLPDGRQAPGRWPCAETDMLWPEVVATLHDLCSHEAESKTALPAWGPYRLRRDVDARRGEARAYTARPRPRENGNVEHVSLHVLDLDGVNASRLWSRVKASKQIRQAFMYASPSDVAENEDARRVRLVCPSTPIAPEQCADLRKGLATMLGLSPGCGVEGALDPARVFFAGRITGAPARETWEK